MENTNKSFIDEVMGFSPEDVSAFNEPERPDYQANVYKTNPAKSKSQDGRYHSRVRILYNPFNLAQSIVNQATYAMTDQDGFFMVRSVLANGDRNCPLFKAWKKLWFSGDEKKKEWARAMFDKTESRWVLVQIIEDENQPELVGKIMVMKLPKAIFDKMNEKMHPSNGKTPQPIMDFLIGNVCEMNVQPGPDDPTKPERKQREISYTLCEFESDATPIIQIDGTPLFTDEEMETIDNYARAKQDVIKAKTEVKKAAAQKQVDALTEPIRALYKKAIEYLRKNSINLEDECAYHPWDEETTTRVNNWIASVLDMRDPKTTDDSQPTSAPKNDQPTEARQEVDPNLSAVMGDDGADDLPF